MEITEFKTDLPIQLDASCNGYQHISLLTKENELFKQLNLSPSTKDDVPGDFYGFIFHKVQESFVKKLENPENLSNEEKESFTRLNTIGFTRKIIKKPLMTKSYNAKTPSMANYIIDSMYPHEIVEN